MMANTLKLGELLLSRGVLRPEELELALLEQRATGDLLGETLLKLNFVDELALIPLIGEQIGLATPELSELQPDPATLDLLPTNVIRSQQCLPIACQLTQASAQVQVAMAHPQDLLHLDRIQQHLPHGYTVTPCLAGKKSLSRAIDRLLGKPEKTLDATLLKVEENPEARYEGHAIIHLVDHLLTEAVDQGASDIHFEPDLQVLRIRVRLDGLLRTTRILRIHLWPALLVRLKLLNGMDISLTRQAQDGRMSLERTTGTIDIRASTLPTLHGEHLVLRLLDRNRGIRPLSSLGLAQDQETLLQRLLGKPEGLLLVTGPTGSGKTTTLYAMLRHLQHDNLLIMTLEDPVEYALPGIRQTAIDPPRLDFSEGIRAMLRQDPDIMLIGEIRDEDTATMALRAAQTGHRVFSTLHASSPFAALPRLQQLGLPLPALRGSLTAILSQRLLRRLCPHCCRPVPANPRDLNQLGLNPIAHPGLILHEAVGCSRCGHSGYRGQLLLLEILPFPPTLEVLLEDQHRPDYLATLALARKFGWQSLAEHGRQRVLAGETSLSELARTVLLDFTTMVSPHPHLT